MGLIRADNEHGVTFYNYVLEPSYLSRHCAGPGPTSCKASRLVSDSRASDLCPMFLAPFYRPDTETDLVMDVNANPIHQGPRQHVSDTRKDRMSPVVRRENMNTSRNT